MVVNYYIKWGKKWQIVAGVQIKAISTSILQLGACTISHELKRPDDLICRVRKPFRKRDTAAKIKCMLCTESLSWWWPGAWCIFNIEFNVILITSSNLQLDWSLNFRKLAILEFRISVRAIFSCSYFYSVWKFTGKGVVCRRGAGLSMSIHQRWNDNNEPVDEAVML